MLVVHKRFLRNTTNYLYQSKCYYFNSTCLRWLSFLQHVARALGYQLTYVIWLFCYIVASDYFNRVISLGTLLCAFFGGSCSGCCDVEKALATHA